VLHIGKRACEDKESEGEDSKELAQDIKANQNIHHSKAKAESADILRDPGKEIMLDRPYKIKGMIAKGDRDENNAKVHKARENEKKQEPVRHSKAAHKKKQESGDKDESAEQKPEKIIPAHTKKKRGMRLNK